MSLIALAERADRLGLRPVVAKAATLAYRDQAFSVDEDGDWVNAQPDCTIVSPVIHTAPKSGFGAWVSDNWLYAYVPQFGDTIVDLGTGIGEEAIIFSPLIGPEGTMLAIEAHPGTFRCLRKTVELSGLSNVRPVHCAVGDSDGTIQIEEGVTHLVSDIHHGSGVDVPMMTLDTLTADLPRIDFLRTNIEGAERLMLAGMEQSVRKIRHACISCHDFQGTPEGRSREAVVSFFKEHGFDISMRPNTPAPMCDYVYVSAR